MREAILTRALPKLLGKVNTLLLLSVGSQPSSRFDVDLVVLINELVSCELTKFHEEHVCQIKALVQRVVSSVLAHANFAQLEKLQNPLALLDGL